MLTVGSLFSGIGGFDLGFERAGMRVLWQCEIDRDARRVLRRRWPDAELYGDAAELRGGDLPAVDVLCGGFPCQDLSVAGRRAGLAGERSGLFYQFARLIAECRPAWVVIENVPGLLSSQGGRDMGIVLGTLGELGYWWAYRVLDAQYFGVAQRRRRVFIVGHAGVRGYPASVLFEPESCGGDPAPSREARQGVAGSLGGGSGSRGWAPDTDRMTFPPDVQNAVLSRYGKGADSYVSDGLITDEVSYALSARAAMDRPERGAVSLVAQLTYSLRSDAGRDGRALTPSPDAKGRVRLRDPGFTVEEELSPTLDAVQPHTVAHPLAPTLAFHMTQDPISEEEFAPAWGAEQGTASIAVAIPLAMRGRGDGAEMEMGDPDVYNALRAGNGGSSRANHVLTQMAVRRLTPVECERLQGFPDGWTEALSDSARYRCLGNAVCVPVSEWVGRRIVAVQQGDRAR